MLLAGKRIVVTGASRGLGAAIAKACAREGATVGINYQRAHAAAEALAAHLGELGGDRAELLPFDVADADTARRALTSFAERGGLDGLVNNAGVFRSGLLVTQELDAIQQQIRVNLLGPVVCAQVALEHMLREKRGGVIVNITSVSARRPVRGQSVYAATKGAVEALTRALAVEYARKGIRVHAVEVGPIETDMMAATKALAESEVLSRIPLRRIGNPSEVAEMVAFLLSDKASYCTGATYTVDGGYSLS